VFGGGVWAAAMAVTVFSAAAHTEDYCDTLSITSNFEVDESKNNGEKIEKEVREKCKVGDIIYLAYGGLVGRLCDLHQPISSIGTSGGACFLAPRRRTY
jgi:hypothetical protein